MGYLWNCGVGGFLAFSVLMGPGLAALGSTSDWPTFRGDARRSGFAATQIQVPLQLRWTFRTAQAPQPAWPAPARGSYWQQLSRIEPRVVDDRGYHPVVANGHVFFASSADDHLHCLDLATGNCRWTFATDAPLRFAPCWHNGRLLCGGDDGVLYCLDAREGNLLWKRRLAPEDWRIPGNGRLISSWPMRTGVVVDDDVVYATCGLFPHQGVFAFAVAVESGDVIWRQRLDFSAQGYLLASRQHLFVPTGRGNPVALSKKDGALLRSFEGVGGSYAVVTENELVAGRGNDGTLTVSDTATRERLASFRGQQIVLSPSHSYLLGAGRLVAIDRTRYATAARAIAGLRAKRSRLQAELANVQDEQGEVVRSQLINVSERLDHAEQEQRVSIAWEIAVPHDQSLAGCQSHLIAGGQNVVAAYSLEHGQEVWSAEVDGDAVGLALDPEGLIVTTDRGLVYCFAAGHAARPGNSEAAIVTDRVNAGRPGLPADHGARLSGTEVAPPRASRTGVEVASRAKRALGQLESLRGYALILGIENGELIDQLVRQSELHVVAVDTDLEKVKAVQRRLLAAGRYGHRAVAHHLQSDALPFTDYFANLVMSEHAPAATSDFAWSQAEIERVTRPFGGVIWLPGKSEPVRRGPLAGAGRWTHQYANGANTANSRDELITSDLQLQWFGGPGPSRMVDRHLRGPAPLCANGRLVVPGENCLIGVDAYNGVEQWQVDLPASQRYTMPYDAGYMSLAEDSVYVAVGEECWKIDAKSGAHVATWKVPSGSGPTAWGYVLAEHDRLFGTRQFATAARTQPSRQLINQDYGHDQPLVTSRGIFLLDQATGSPTWTYADTVILNTTIAVDGGQMFFVETRSPAALHDRTGRLKLATLLSADVHVTALDASSGKLKWRVVLPENLTQARSILYLQSGRELVVMLGSYRGEDNDTRYCLAALRKSDGEIVWTAEHAEEKPGAASHGEQVHHPVLLDNRLMAEPVLYDLEHGELVRLGAQPEAWRLIRPGHSCGTLSGSADCLFFRANNPTVLDLGALTAGKEHLQKLAPSRPGCWINIIPASGLLLIPEASASCVCHYSLQTSMAFRPRPR